MGIHTIIITLYYYLKTSVNVFDLWRKSTNTYLIIVWVFVFNFQKTSQVQTFHFQRFSQAFNLLWCMIYIYTSYNYFMIFYYFIVLLWINFWRKANSRWKYFSAKIHPRYCQSKQWNWGWWNHWEERFQTQSKQECWWKRKSKQWQIWQ